MSGITREERLADPEMKGDPITVESLTFKAGFDCWSEPEWRSHRGYGSYRVSHSQGHDAQGKGWWYRQDIGDGPSEFYGTVATRQEAMRACADHYGPRQAHRERVARWNQYMATHEPPED